MKTLKLTACFAILILIALLAVTSCQSAPKPQPTETVVAEGEVNCPILDFEMKDGTDDEDPELGYMSRGAFVSWRFDCQDPYWKGKFVGWQDFYTPDGGESWLWYGYYEGVTDEGGVWISMKEDIPPLSLNTGRGEGKYKGLINNMETDIGQEADNFIMRYRITKPPTVAPTAMPEGTVVAEGEASCPIVDNTSEGGIQYTDPELGEMERGIMVTWRNDCAEPYIGGQCFGLQDSYSAGGDKVNSKIFYECITGDSGAWLCNSEVRSPGATITCEGLSKYKGLLLSEEYNLDTGTVKYRVTQLDGE